MRQPEPSALTAYKAWIAKGPPRFCHNCDHYGLEGECFAFHSVPPLEFTQQEDCPSWEQELPF